MHSPCRMRFARDTDQAWCSTTGERARVPPPDWSSHRASTGCPEGLPSVEGRPRWKLKPRLQRWGWPFPPCRRPRIRGARGADRQSCLSCWPRPRQGRWLSIQRAGADGNLGRRGARSDPLHRARASLVAQRVDWRPRPRGPDCEGRRLTFMLSPVSTAPRTLPVAAPTC